MNENPKRTNVAVCLEEHRSIKFDPFCDSLTHVIVSGSGRVEYCQNYVRKLKGEKKACAIFNASGLTPGHSVAGWIVLKSRSP